VTWDYTIPHGQQCQLGYILDWQPELVTYRCRQCLHSVRHRRHMDTPELASLRSQWYAIDRDYSRVWRDTAAGAGSWEMVHRLATERDKIRYLIDELAGLPGEPAGSPGQAGE